MRCVLSPLCKCPSRELWRREASIDQTIQSARDEMTKCERNLRATVGKVYTVEVVFVIFIIGSQLVLQEKEIVSAVTISPSAHIHVAFLVGYTYVCNLSI